MKEPTKSLLAILGVLIAFSGLLFMFDNYLNEKIDEKITSKRYLETLSTTLRPFMIFDKDGIIIYDHGARIYIDSISVTESKVTIYPNQYLQIAPLLESIGSEIFKVKPIRAKGNIWIYQILPVLGLPISKSDTRFRLEILK